MVIITHAAIEETARRHGLPIPAAIRRLVQDGLAQIAAKRPRPKFDWDAHADEILRLCRQSAKAARTPLMPDFDDRLDWFIAHLWRRLQKADPTRFNDERHAIYTAQRYVRLDWNRHLKTLRKTEGRRLDAPDLIAEIAKSPQDLPAEIATLPPHLATLPPPLDALAAALASGHTRDQARRLLGIPKREMPRLLDALRAALLQQDAPTPHHQQLPTTSNRPSP